jgi:thiol-disulfide isomerase/thioredoxin
MKSICMLFLSGLLLACSQQSAPPLPVGIQAKPLSDGRWLFINYWAIWCHPCREEIPQLNEFAAGHSNEAIVYGVNYDEVDNDTLLVQADELAITFPLLAIDPAQALGYPKPMVLPTTLVINPQGEVWARLLGPQTVGSLTAAMQSEQQKLAPPVH